MTVEPITFMLSSVALRHRAVDAVTAAGMAVADEAAPEAGLVVVDVDVEELMPDRCHVVLAASATRADTAQLLDRGARGVVLIDELERTLAPTIRAVVAGQLVVPYTARSAVRRPILSPREKQILGMVVMGCTNQEIGARLHLAPSTIKSHLGTMFTELGVRSRKEAADLVLDPSASLGTGILTIAPGEYDAAG